MCAHINPGKPNIVLSVLQNKCPRCRRGKMFRHNNAYKLQSFMRMNEQCPLCKQPLDMEPGFYYGTSYVSYGLSLMICVASLIAWWIFIGFSLGDNRFFWWIAVNGVLLVIMQPLLMRLSRSVWIYFFVSYDQEWASRPPQKPERINEDLKNAW